MIHDILLVAYELAMLTFFTGILIYALPIPWYPLKRWAPRLIMDSIFIAIIIIMFYTILDMSNFIARILGGSWDLFYKWLKTSIETMISLKALVFIIKILASKYTILEAIKSNLRPLDRAADAGIFVIAWVWGLKLIVRDFGQALAAIGVALMSVPFRIARSAGAWLLSFIIVFNAGLQVLPVFLSTIAESPGRPDPSQLEENGLAFATVYVQDVINSPVGGGIGHMYNPSRKEWGRYHISGGVATASTFGSVLPVPSRTETYWVLEVDNVAFPLSPYPLYPSDYSTGPNGIWEAHLRNPFLIWIGNYTIAYTNASIIDVNKSHSLVRVRIETLGSSYFTIRVPSTCNITFSSNGGDLSVFSWSWAGIYGKAYRLSFSNSSSYTINITINSCKKPNPDLGETFNYLDKVGQLGTFTDIDFIEAFLLYYLTIPFLYTFILLSITAGLARLLGGRDRLPIRL